jgi:hypothetical protein
MRIILGSQKTSSTLEQDHSRRYPMAHEEEVMQALQQLQELTIADTGSKEDNPSSQCTTATRPYC